nr:phosphohydrolase [Desulfuromusa sp.]
RHIGVGLTVEEIQQQHLPLPARDMRPKTLEEQLICYADLFFSKDNKNRDREKTPAEIREKLQKYGKNKMIIFDQWLKEFEPNLS